jgi:hypothetical protein
MGDHERRVLQFGRSKPFARRFPASKQLFHEPNHRLETNRLEPTVQTTPKKPVEQEVTEETEMGFPGNEAQGRESSVRPAVLEAIAQRSK